MAITHYRRPSIEIEFDRAALEAPGSCPCACRFVRVVLRVCEFPASQGATLDVTTRRARVGATDHYDTHYGHHQHSAASDSPDYLEYHLELLARAEAEETGELALQLLSATRNELAQARFRFVAGVAEPECLVYDRFATLRFHPAIRTPEQRVAQVAQIAINEARSITASQGTLL